MTTEKVLKSSTNFYCINCDYNTPRQSQYIRHLSTRKHQNTTKYNNTEPEIKNYVCECTKIYYHRASLYNHKKSCSYHIHPAQKENIIISKSEEVKILINENADFKNIILDMIKNNNETQKQTNEVQAHNNELHKQMIELCKNNNITTISNTNNNSNNNTFNLQVFLNERCKDAMNLTDFISSIELNLSDLENMEKLGYTDCMFNNIFGNMNILDFCARPFHCSDLKREIMYIKDNDVWEKEDADHSKLKNAIRSIEKKNFKLLNEWTNKYPTFKDYDSPYNDKYLKIVGQTMSGDKEHMIKVIRKLAKSCVIDKQKI